MEKVIVITGASSGIGLNTSKLLKKEGNLIINISRSSCQYADENYIADISNKEEIVRIFQEIKNNHEKIDVLINNAGYGMSGVTELLDFEDCKKLFDVNFFGSLLCIQKALPLMHKGGKIINIGSAMGLFPLPFRTLYGACKSAIINFSFGLRMELAPLGISVTVICPGNTKTNFTKNRVKEFKTDDRYGDRIYKATNKIDSKDDKRMSPDIVAKAIIKQVNAKKTKPMIIVGGKYKLLYFFTNITPKNLLLKLTSCLYNGKSK